jgi:hypothetical protein
MTEQLITSFSERGAFLYGTRMIGSVCRHWAPAIEVVAYLDARPANYRLPPRVAVRWTTDLPAWMACRTRWAREPMLQGFGPAPSSRARYHYRWDAARFAVKVFVWRDAAQRLGRGVLTWLDGDTETLSPIPAGWPTTLLGDADVAYLGRGSMHPETGYVGFRVPEALPLLEWCCETYRGGSFQALSGWTDCHVLRAGLAAVPVRARDLTGARYEGKSHIWPVSPLAGFVRHDKGKSKRDALRKRWAVA